MHSPDKPLRAQRRRSQATDTSEAKEQSSPPKRCSRRKASLEKLATALPVPLEPEPVLHSIPDKARKAARTSTPVSRRLSTAAARKNFQARAAKAVRFAPGPLKAPAGGPDGHPVAEGRVAKPVRVLDGGFARGVSVTKRDVRELDLPELLGNEQYQHSLTKLKVRVGLLPASPPARPHANKLRKAAVQRPKPGDAAAAGVADGCSTGARAGSSDGRKKRRCGGA